MLKCRRDSVSYYNTISIRPSLTVRSVVKKLVCQVLEISQDIATMAT